MQFWSKQAKNEATKLLDDLNETMNGMGLNSTYSENDLANPQSAATAPREEDIDQENTNASISNDLGDIKFVTTKDQRELRFNTKVPLQAQKQTVRSDLNVPESVIRRPSNIDVSGQSSTETFESTLESTAWADGSTPKVPSNFAPSRNSTKIPGSEERVGLSEGILKKNSSEGDRYGTMRSPDPRRVRYGGESRHSYHRDQPTPSRSRSRYSFQPRCLYEEESDLPPEYVPRDSVPVSQMKYEWSSEEENVDEWESRQKSCNLRSSTPSLYYKSRSPTRGSSSRKHRKSYFDTSSDSSDYGKYNIRTHEKSPTRRNRSRHSQKKTTRKSKSKSPRRNRSSHRRRSPSESSSTTTSDSDSDSNSHSDSDSESDYYAENLKVPRGLIKDMRNFKPFTGSSGNPKHLQIFLSDFEEMVKVTTSKKQRANKKYFDRLCAMCIRSHISGEALQFLRDQPSSVRSSYKKVKRALEERYAESLDSEFILHKLTTLKQGEIPVLALKEKLTYWVNYYLKVDESMKKSTTKQRKDRREFLLRSNFIRALHPEIYAHLAMEGRPKTFESAVRKAVKVESALRSIKAHHEPMYDEGVPRTMRSENQPSRSRPNRGYNGRRPVQAVCKQDNPTPPPANLVMNPPIDTSRPPPFNPRGEVRDNRYQPHQNPL